MSNLENLTILIMTYNRYGFLQRLLDYYLSFPFQYRIIILDSSSDVMDSPRLSQIFAGPQVMYKKYDSSIYATYKISAGLDLVKTPYAVLCADDDFLIPDGLKQSVDFLMTHPEYACAQGRYVNHLLKETPSGRRFIWSSLYSQAESIEEEQSLERFKNFFPKNYGTLPFYAVHRSADLNLVWQQTKEYVHTSLFAEIFPACASVLAGKVKILPVFYSSREANTRSWYNDQQRKDMVAPPIVNKSIDGLMDLMVRRFGGIEQGAREVFQNRFDAYVERMLSSQLHRALPGFKKKVQRRLNDMMFVLGMGTNIGSFFKNLEIIRKVVRNAGLSAHLLNRPRETYIDLQSISQKENNV